MATIVTVDDSAFVTKELTRFLEADGHTVLANGENGYDGVELFRTHRPDLLMLDITMPNMSGRECLSLVLDESPEARVVIVSAIRERATIVDCLAAGAKGYVEKPIRFRDEAFCEEFRKTLTLALED